MTLKKKKKKKKTFSVGRLFTVGRTWTIKQFIFFGLSVLSFSPEATLVLDLQLYKKKHLNEEKEKEKEEKKTTEQKENIYALFHRHR